MLDNRNKTYDVLAVLQDTSRATMSTSGRGFMIPDGATVATETFFDTGGGFTEGHLVIDVMQASPINGGEVITNIGEAAAGDRNQRLAIILEGSHYAAVGTFGTAAPCATLLIGAGGAVGGNTTVTSLFPQGMMQMSTLNNVRYVVPYSNAYGDQVFRYLRIWHQFNGTWATGIKYQAFLTS